MTSDQRLATETVEPAPTSRADASRGTIFGRRIDFRILILAMVVLDVLAYLLVPPFVKGDRTASCSYPLCFINGTLEFPAPHVVWDFAPASAPAAGQMIFFHPSITSTLLTMWIVMFVVLALVILSTRGRRLVPGPLQNAIEYVYELLEDFGTSIGGEAARPYIPIFAGFFLFIIFCNWSGLVPPIGKLDELRAPTSDVNVTIGLALVAFVFFEAEGFHKLGVRGYLRKFFPLGEFRHGLAAGFIAMFVGLIELLLEFVKPLTLSMRLFGNIFGGEVAIGVLTGLTVVLVPVGLLFLELILNFAQALIFSTLTLMFTVLAIESHEEEEAVSEAAAAVGEAA
ncbi:MAG: F0F1 ATP synthase subunit A [Candidatus Limnocylindrales bacterium]